MFAGVGERTREGNDLYHEMIESGVNKDPKKNNGSTAGSKCALVYGQMNEPPGARARVGLSGLTVAEHFRDQGQDVLFFVDNIFRFTQAGSEVSALLGRIPSAVGYQPTLATDMGALQERITTTHQGLGHLGAGDLRAGRRPDRSGAGDLVRALGRHHRAVARHRRQGHLSGGRSARLDLAHAVAADRRRGALRHRAAGAAGAAALQGAAGHHRHSRHGRALRRGQARGVARAQDRALPVSQPFFVAEVFTGSPGKLVDLADTIKGFKGLVEGKYDHLPEAAFYMVGTIEEAVEKGKKLAAEAA